MKYLNKNSLLLLVYSFLFLSCNKEIKEVREKKEKTIFQTGTHWRPSLDNRGDVVMIYSVNGNSAQHDRKSFEERVKSWRDRGYTTHFMTGIAWGDYEDYFTGKWDGREHFDEAQMGVNGDTIWHGHLSPYIVPTDNFLKYIKEAHVKRAIDAGIDAIYLEEPEFWAHAGYSEAFRKEWEKYYGFDWRPQHESPENTYLSSKLKYHLYHNALEDVFTYAKEYGKSKGMNIRCYVPTHSLVNYSQWRIVSPEASLASLSVVDGYIAQVWTGTSREPNHYNGVRKERVFENAFLEYGSMESMTAPTGRKTYFLTDPIEDWPRDWVDYKKNYEATFVAQLMYPNNNNYQIMPWPERIYEGHFKTDANSDRREKIPTHYSTQMQVMINSLNFMPLSTNKVSGSTGISILMSNSLMFQRFPTHKNYDDPQLANFYGLSLPLLKRGIPVTTAHIENLEFSETLKETKILLMTYSNMKPLDPKSHDYLAKWIYYGGVIVYSGKDSDPFQTVQEWWNTDSNNYKAVSDHLFEKMGIMPSPQEGKYTYGNGAVYVLRNDPKEYVLSPQMDKVLVELLQQIYKEKNQGNNLKFKNNFYLERGPYTMIAVMDEGITSEAYLAQGLFIDLFDPTLPILTQKKVATNEQAYLFDINRVENKKKAQVLASAARIYDEIATSHSFNFMAKSPMNTNNVMRILLPSKFTYCIVLDNEGRQLTSAQWKWSAESMTLKLAFENNPDGVFVKIRW